MRTTKLLWQVYARREVRIIFNMTENGLEKLKLKLREFAEARDWDQIQNLASSSIAGYRRGDDVFFIRIGRPEQIKCVQKVHDEARQRF